MTFEVSLDNTGLVSKEARRELAKYWHYCSEKDSYICLSAESLFSFGGALACATRGEEVPRATITQLS
jgi:hypothetical protein